MFSRHSPRQAATGALAWLLASACIAAEAQAEPAAPPPAALRAAVGFDLNVLDREIAREMRDNPKLRGAWLFVESETPDNTRDDAAVPGKLRFRRVLDRRRAAAQRQELSRLIAAGAPAANSRVDAKLDR